jgi:D-sedoheptulose 7-phosphate isomerase
MGSKTYNFKEEIIQHIEGSITVKEKLLKESVDQINTIANIMIKAYKKEKKILWCGNGGSAADAQHLACELVSKFYLERKPIRSIALSTNTSIITAIGNDYQYDQIFQRQVEALAEKEDILVGITTSGTSKNIINAFKTANELGVTTVALTGNHIEALQDYADYILAIPSNSTPRIQEAHIMIGHILCYLIEQTLYGDKTWATEQYSSIETAP